MSDDENWDDLNARGAASVARQQRESASAINHAHASNYRIEKDVNGKTVHIPQPDGAGHKNPPLTELNASSRKIDEALRSSRPDMELDELHAAERRRAGKGEKRISATPPRPEYHGTAYPK